MEKLIVGLLRVLCPYLKDMAARTKSPVDDLIVSLICRLAGHDPEES